MHIALVVMITLLYSAMADDAIIADDDRPSSLGVLAGLPRPSFSLGGVSSDLATYARDTDKFQPVVILQNTLFTAIAWIFIPAYCFAIPMTGSTWTN